MSIEEKVVEKKEEEKEKSRRRRKYLRPSGQLFKKVSHTHN